MKIKRSDISRGIQEVTKPYIQARAPGKPGIAHDPVVNTTLKVCLTATAFFAAIFILWGIAHGILN